MAASKRGKREKSVSRSVASMVRPLQYVSPSLLAGLALIITCIVAAVYAWQHWEIGTVARSGSKMNTDSITISPQPAWIKVDVRAEAARDGSLQELSILDKELTYKVYRAFEMHPWVAKVNRVSKQPPDTVIVDLDYRQPVAWVEIPSFMSPENKDGVLPVDVEGLLLPPNGFTEQEVSQYLRIAISDLLPWGPVGTHWPDARVAGAARLAALVHTHHQPLGLHRILVSANFAGIANEPVYELVTRGGRRLIWGSAPGREKTGEAADATKLQILLQIAERLGSLDQLDHRQQLDLRQVESERINPRTARGPRTGAR